MGLVGRSEGKKLDIPLISIQASLVSHDTSGIVTVTQTYFNPCKQSIQAFYTFPLYEDATITACNIEFKTGKITCVVKEKSSAEKEYIRASTLEALMHRRISGEPDEHYDVSVGSIDPLEEVVVVIKYLTVLKWDLVKKSFRFTFPTTIMPHYDNRTDCTNTFGQSYDNRSSSSSTFTKSYTGYLMEVPDPKGLQEILYSEMAKNVTLDVSVDCTLNNLLKSIEPMDSFNGHCLERNILDNKGMIRFGNIKMDRDFIIHIVPVDSNPYCDYIMQEQHPDGSFTWKIQLDAKKIVKRVPNRQFEFIFVVDQSASMVGSQLKHARQALDILVNSLQHGSIFNVYGFGSSFYSFFQRSVNYNEATLNAAKKFIREKLQESLGENKIHAPFQYIYGLKKSFGFERRIILLTDGKAQNIQELFDICRRDPETRVYTIGFGVNHSLVEGLAKNTGGNCVVVDENELIEEKCMYQLNLAMCEPVEAEIEDEKVHIIPGSMFVDHRIVQKGIPGEHVQISITGPDEPDLIVKVINCGKTDFSPLRLQSIKESISKLTKKHDRLEESSEKNNIYKKIVDLSTKYNLLCPYTAFVGILEGPMGDTSALVSQLSAEKYASSTAFGFSNTYPTSNAPPPIRLNCSIPVFNFGHPQTSFFCSPSSSATALFGCPSSTTTLFATPHPNPSPSFGSSCPSFGPSLSAPTHFGSCPSFGPSLSAPTHFGSPSSSQTSLYSSPPSSATALFGYPSSTTPPQSFGSCFRAILSRLEHMQTAAYTTPNFGPSLSSTTTTLPLFDSQTSLLGSVPPPIDRSFMGTLLIRCQNLDGSFLNFLPSALVSHFRNKSNVPDVIWYTIIAQMMVRHVNSTQDCDEIPIKWRAMYEKAEAYIAKNGVPIEVAKAIEVIEALFDRCLFV